MKKLNRVASSILDNIVDMLKQQDCFRKWYLFSFNLLCIMTKTVLEMTLGKQFYA